MNAVEIEEAVSQLAAAKFNAAEFPYAFLEAFGNKAITINRLRSGSSNSSEFVGGVLQRNNIHIAICAEGKVTETLAALRASPRTTTAKAKFALATDGITLEAEDTTSGETVTCADFCFPWWARGPQPWRVAFDSRQASRIRHRVQIIHRHLKHAGLSIFSESR